MPIIGKLLKKTTAIGYKRNFNKGKEYHDQLKMLEKLLVKAKNTKFGFHYDFQQTLEQEEIVESFQSTVPIVDYERFYDTWLKHSILGVKDNTWPGKIKHYALSSGTTGSPSKRIPVTEEMIRTFQKSSMRQITMLHELNLSEEFYNASILAVGGCTKLVKKPTHIEGDLSGILKKHTSFILSPFAKPGKRIAGIKDWNEKMEKMIEKAPNWNIGVIAGVPSWCIMLMERIIERYNLKSIHDIWPNFDVYVHGGVFMKPYIPRLEKVLGKKVHLLDTYLASEGYFGFQTSVERKGMQLLLDTGVFFEFVPFNSEFFDENGNLRDPHRAFTLSEVEEGIDYAMVITTNAGLWRYMIGDLVRFVDVEEREVVLTGRIKQFLSLCGEHLSLDNINEAIVSTAEKLKIEISEFCIYPKVDLQKHSWFIGTKSKMDKKRILSTIDKKLKELNDDYASARKYTLTDPEITVLDPDCFYRFMNAIGKSGSQNKFPRVMNEQQSQQWLNYLKEINVNA
jgi:signal recognition particle subunit SEC65